MDVVIDVHLNFFDGRRADGVGGDVYEVEVDFVGQGVDPHDGRVSKDDGLDAHGALDFPHGAMNSPSQGAVPVVPPAADDE